MKEWRRYLLEKLASRKFIVAMSALSSATMLMHQHLISDGVYSTIVVAVVGAYVTANVMQKRTEK